MNYYRLITYFTSILFFCQTLQVDAVNFVIKNLPLHHPHNETLFLVGSFNAWNPSDQKYQFFKNEEGQWMVTVPDQLNAFEYKITRGDWSKVESTQDGKPKANRVFISENESDTVFIDILGWEDLAGQTTIILHEIPSSTPYESKFFLAGDFNDWDPANTNYQFNKDENGLYTFTLPSSIADFEFKVSRGSWSTIECLSNGRYRPNRVYHHTSKGPEQIIVSVDDWEDVFKGHFWELPQLTQFLLFHLFLLTIYILWMNHGHHQLKLTLMILLSGLSTVTLYWTSYYLPTKNALGSIHLFHYLMIPLVYLIIANVQDDVFRSFQPKKYLSVIFLLGVGLLASLGCYLMQEEPLLLIFHERKYPTINLLVKVFFVSTSLIGWYFSKKHLKEYNTESLQGSTVKLVRKAFEYYQKVGLVIIMAFFGALVIQGYLVFSFQNNFELQDLSDEIIWYATFTYLIFISAWVFKYHAFIKPIDQKSTYRKEEMTSTNKEIEEFIEKMTQLFERDKLYTKHDLTLNDVANLLDIPSHKLTKLIHQAYKRNFSELVNDYRVQAFTKRVLIGDAEKSTLLSIAYEVGFQSKSTFNRAFKKSTGVTPKEYMQKSAVKKILED
ncbi:helix-turn-helix domain-containing protein [Flammeovirga yaeyamensis]|uniref:Helix-turn-helix domain-containing protein n=1 Tax=Flammeovirga yaeyamensis TaxID=367791 RepID=A0AAX1N7W2_9BACT|nr:helix-turn-helix domain-containing protein [Flammeovirga yaeyamensis]MBB3700557.1 AraC-like DNA-binding protein [Flammeovirga yaeyamensis]NMF37674.1 helix-turn-helix domain-containing protein [Flammeovirga yaeyamensis]QWG01983.1 helix-turn-helix domain-containing protein [Flammeovirga yaeyamensis]